MPYSETCLALMFKVSFHYPPYVAYLLKCQDRDYKVTLPDTIKHYITDWKSKLISMGNTETHSRLKMHMHSSRCPPPRRWLCLGSVCDVNIHVDHVRTSARYCSFSSYSSQTGGKTDTEMDRRRVPPSSTLLRWGTNIHINTTFLQNGTLDLS